MATTDHRRALLLALAVTVLWSSSWVLIRWGLDDHGLDPIGFAGLRYCLAVLVLASFVVARPRLRRALADLDRVATGQLFSLGIVFITLAQGAQFVAIDSQPAATTSLALSAAPLVVALVSQRILGEPPTVPQIAGTVLIVGGALAYFSGDLGFTPVGLTASFVGLMANAAGALMGRSINRFAGRPAEVVTLVSMSFGAVLLLAIGVAIEGWPALDRGGWAIVAWLAVVNTAVAFTWWNWSLRHLDATASAGINNTMLVQIAVLAWVFLGETPSVWQWAGIGVVTLGVALAQTRRTAVLASPPGR